MTPTPISTSWLWRAGDGMNGLKLNTDRVLLEWYDSFGCACGDSTAEQTPADFRRKGAYLGLPDDIKAELETALAVLGWA